MRRRRRGSPSGWSDQDLQWRSLRATKSWCHGLSSPWRCPATSSALFPSLAQRRSGPGHYGDPCCEATKGSTIGSVHPIHTGSGARPPTGERHVSTQRKIIFNPCLLWERPPCWLTLHPDRRAEIKLTFLGMNKAKPHGNKKGIHTVSIRVKPQSIAWH